MCSFEFCQEVVPLGQVGFSLTAEAGLFQNDVVEALLVHLEGHFIDGGHVQRLYYGVGAHVAELSHLLQHSRWQRVLGAQHQNVGLDTLLLQQLDAMLGRLGLELLSSADIGDIGQMDANATFAQFPTQLPYRLDKRQGLDIAHGTTNLGDDKVILARGAQ